jgi:hypothetical protein
MGDGAYSPGEEAWAAFRRRRGRAPQDSLAEEQVRYSPVARSGSAPALVRIHPYVELRPCTDGGMAAFAPQIELRRAMEHGGLLQPATSRRKLGRER